MTTPTPEAIRSLRRGASLSQHFDTKGRLAVVGMSLASESSGVGRDAWLAAMPDWPVHESIAALPRHEERDAVTISAKILADSISPEVGSRLTTLQIRCPRFVRSPPGAVPQRLLQPGHPRGASHCRRGG